MNPLRFVSQSSAERRTSPGERLTGLRLSLRPEVPRKLLLPSTRPRVPSAVAHPVLAAPPHHSHEAPTPGSLARLSPAGRGVTAADLALSCPEPSTPLQRDQPLLPTQSVSCPEAAGTPPFSGLPFLVHSGFPGRMIPDSKGGRHGSLHRDRACCSQPVSGTSWPPSQSLQF